MKQEQIVELRQRQKNYDTLCTQYKEATDIWKKDNLDPLTKECDHMYPWNDSAIKGDHSSQQCDICHQYFCRN